MGALCLGAKLSAKENLKEMGDVTSGMASTVIQLYLKQIMDAFVHQDVGVRRAALKVIQLILAQGLVHPVQVRFLTSAPEPSFVKNRTFPAQFDLFGC